MHTVVLGLRHVRRTAARQVEGFPAVRPRRNLPTPRSVAENRIPAACQARAYPTLSQMPSACNPGSFYKPALFQTIWQAKNHRLQIAEAAGSANAMARR